MSTTPAPSRTPYASGRSAAGWSDVTIGIIAALPVEGAAMAALITNPVAVRVDGDPNDYRVGHLDSLEPARPHRVVLTTMVQDNTRNAATTCTDLLRTFPGIRCVIMTGIAGGVPSLARPERHVRLGDVVVAVDGVVDYAHVRERCGTEEPRRPVPGVSIELIHAAVRLQEMAYQGRAPQWSRWLKPSQEQPMAVFARPPASTDQLHYGDTLIDHPPLNASGHDKGRPKIHYGRIGCADVLLLDEKRRDHLAARHDVLAFEMEAAGIAAGAAGHGVGWFMVRGIVDYCNVHKTDRWHPYASLAAAGCVRGLLAECRPFPIWRKAPGSGVIALLPDHELDRLIELLDRLPELDLQAISRVALGWLTPLPESPPATLYELFTYLADLNAGADHVPPALALAEEIAVQIEHRLRAQLRRWIDQMAERLQILEVMRRHRALVEERRQRQQTASQEMPPVQPCLVIQIEGDGIDRERCEVRYWIQRRSAGWHPEPGDPRKTTFRRVELAMQAAIRHAETAWRDNNGPVGIEFLLPTELLHQAVEWWETELEAPTPTPLCLDYPVVVRSLDRMRAVYRHRVWANRWRAMWRHSPGHRPYWGRIGVTHADLGQWNARLRDDENITTVVLSASPKHEAGREELQSALNAGVPVILWDRRTPVEPDTARLIGRVARGDPTQLPHRIRALRTEAATALPDEQRRHLGWHLALLWDDPNRTVDDGRPQP